MSEFSHSENEDRTVEGVSTLLDPQCFPRTHSLWGGDRRGLPSKDRLDYLGRRGHPKTDRGRKESECRVGVVQDQGLGTISES